jgi:uncharacterized protein (DUF433 family)
MSEHRPPELGVSPSLSAVAPEAISWIQKTPGVCGGRACIRNTRITIWGLVSYRKLGLSDARLRETIAGLTQTDLATAWEYYERNRAEIEQDLMENEEA